MSAADEVLQAAARRSAALVARDPAVLVGVVHDEFERDGEPGTFDMPLTLTWVREEGTWRVLAAHAGPPR